MYLNESAQPGPPTCDTATAFCRPVPGYLAHCRPGPPLDEPHYQIGH